MLRLIGLIAQATLLLLVVYNATTSMWGWPDFRPARVGTRQRRLRVVVPAHNEAGVIAGLLADLQSAAYPSDLFDLWVLADRCTDKTVAIARSMGIRVAERSEGSGGKGEALSWFLEAQPLADHETLVVFDADNRVPPEALGRISDEIDAGAAAIQCYLDAVNPSGSLLAEASALSYWAGNRMVQLARTNLGWSADLGGTGMAVTAKALSDAGGFSRSLTEDQDLGVRLLLSGNRVLWLHDVRIEDEKPRTVGVAIRQRARWMAGKRAARRRHLWALLSSPSPARLDMAIRLIQPGRSFMALLSGLITLVAVFGPREWSLPWQVWAVATAVQVLQPVPFLAREGVSPRSISRYPLLVILAALWIPVRLMSSLVKGWYHTPHVGATSDHGENAAP